MNLYSPVKITPRLMAGVHVGNAWLSIGYSKRPGGNGGLRTRYVYHIDAPDFEHTGDDLQSGCGGGSLQSGLESLLSFLSAAGDAYAYSMRTGDDSENSDLFPPAVAEWAYQNSDELSMLAMELEESASTLIDENR